MESNLTPEERARLVDPGPIMLWTLILGSLTIIRKVSIPVGCLFLVVDAVVYFLGVMSGGFGFILLIPLRIVELLYAITWVTRHNRRILKY